MMKAIFAKKTLLPLVVLISVLIFGALTSCFSEAKDAAKKAENHEVEILYSGPAGAKAAMTFSQKDARYSAKLTLKVPLYSLELTSRGKIEGNKLLPVTYTDSRRAGPYSKSHFNYADHTVTFGKIDAQKSAPFTGETFDVLSLPWQISLNPNFILENLVLSNGKKIYPVNIAKTPIKHFMRTKKISTPHGTVVVESYNFSALKTARIPVAFDYAPQYERLPILIHYQNDYLNVDFKATRITVNQKRIF